MKMRSDVRKLKRAYFYHRGNARQRNVPFLFTFEEWMDVWVKSGCLDERGARKGGFVMARIGDIGPYSKDNVKIIKHEDNCAERFAHTPNIWTKELVWVTNGSISKRVRKDAIPDGWRVGRVEAAWNKGVKSGIFYDTTGHRWITNGVSNSWLAPGSLVPKGWRLGRILKSRSKVVLS